MVVCMHAKIGPEAKYYISVTWELTPPHRGGFSNYILSCQTLLLVAYHAPYVSNRDIIVVLISGPKPSLSVVSEWVIGHWLNSCNELCPWFLDTQTMPAGYPFSWKTWQSYQRSIQQSMMLWWRECVLNNGVKRSATVVVLDMVAVTHIIQP